MNVGRNAGYALIILLALMGSVSLIVALPYLSRLENDPLASKLRSANALREAREALIAYAMIEDNSPGSLPCPDQDNDGEAQSGIGSNPCNAPYIGRLPWKTLALGRLTDGEGECLWYAVSAEFRNTIQTGSRGAGQANPAINLSALGSINTAAAPAPSAFVVAALFAPGRPLSHQTARGISPSQFRCADGETADFLELANASGLAVAEGSESSSFNDLSVALTSQQLFAAVGTRVLAALATGEPYGEMGLPQLAKTHGLSAPQLESGLGNNLRRANTESYSLQDFDDALQPMTSSPQRLHYTHATQTAGFPGAPVIVFDPISNCYDYDANYTTQAGTTGVVQSHHPRVPPAEWLCRNAWYDYVKYAAVAPDRARIWIDTVPPVSREVTFQ